nr:hypothetical protein Itr_chr01CG02880 [Ipomoea trifida]
MDGRDNQIKKIKVGAEGCHGSDYGLFPILDLALGLQLIDPLGIESHEWESSNDSCEREELLEVSWPAPGEEYVAAVALEGVGSESSCTSASTLYWLPRLAAEMVEFFLVWREFFPVSAGLAFFVTSIHVPNRFFS